jgi:streptomycin 6-kinase
LEPQPANTWIETVRSLHGERGAAWLAQLPALRERYARRWNLTVGPPLPDLSYNYVAPAVDDAGREYILKLGVPNVETVTEIAALNHYGGQGCARLCESDPEGAALLLERLQPGTMLVAVTGDEEATRIAAAVMQQLWRPAPRCHAYPTVADWGQGLRRLRTEFGGGSGPFPETLVDLAESLFAELLASQATPVVLHGDLHHYNILQAEREPWLAIDPKGVVGEPAYEVGALLRNPLPQVATWPELERVQARRVALLAEMLGFERQRIVAWGIAQAVLAAWWSYEDHGDGGQAMLACAEALADLL